MLHIKHIWRRIEDRSFKFEGLSVALETLFFSDYSYLLHSCLRHVSPTIILVSQRTYAYGFEFGA